MQQSSRPTGGAATHVTPKEQMLIKKVVLEHTNSDVNPSAESANSLIKYLKNPQTVDPTYLMVVERMHEKNAGEPILLRSVRLLKTYLGKYPPSTETLLKLDQICSGIQTSNDAISKSILYIRAIISKLTGGGKTAASVAELRTHRSTASDSAASSSAPETLPVPAGHHHRSGDRKSGGALPTSDSGSNLTLLTPAVLQYCTSFLLLRCLHRISTRKSASSFGNSLLFGGQFRKSSVEGPPTLQNLPAELLVLENIPQIRERVFAVAQEKKKEEFKLVKESGQTTMRRKGPQLFQYKYYKEQVALHLSEEEMAQVVDTVVHPPLGDHETHLIASKILIKLLIDVYCGDERLASNLISPILFEMLSSAQDDIKVHAFNLLFNLSVHMNLLDETSLLGMEASASASSTAGNVASAGAPFDLSSNGTAAVGSAVPSSVPPGAYPLAGAYSSGGGVPAGAPQPPRTQIDQIQEELLQVCLQMLLLLVHRHEDDEKVWSAGFHCLLYFVTQDGRVSDKHLLRLDPRLLPIFIRQQGSAKDALQRRLIRLFVHRLYLPDSSGPPMVGSLVLNVPLLKKTGGIRFVIEQYVQSRSSEALENLFLVIFDFAIHTLSVADKKAPEENSSTATTPVASTPLQINAEAVSLLCDVLRRLEAPVYFQAVFRHVPERLQEQLQRFVFAEQPARDPALQELVGRLDRALTAALFQELERLAAAHLRLEPEFEARLQTLLAAPPPPAPTPPTSTTASRGSNDALANSEAHLRVLADLLHSPVDANRAQGEAFLFGALRAIHEGKKVSSQTAIEAQFVRLSQSPSASLRRIYISLVERLILLHKTRMQTFGDEARLAAIFKLLNENLLRLSKEKNENNLMHIFDLIFSLVSYRIAPELIPDAVDGVGGALGSSGGGGGAASLLLPFSGHSRERDLPDASYDLFLRGRMGVSAHLLLEVNMSLLHALFVQLPPNTHHHSYNHVRTALLLMMIEKCKQQQDALEQVGMSFFRQLLGDRNAAVAFHASRFLIDELQAERPEQYTAILNALLSKAQQTNDEQLLSNPYLQIHEMIRGFAQSEDSAPKPTNPPPPAAGASSPSASASSSAAPSPAVTVTAAPASATAAGGTAPPSPSTTASGNPNRLSMGGLGSSGKK